MTELDQIDKIQQASGCTILQTEIWNSGTRNVDTAQKCKQIVCEKLEMCNVVQYCKLLPFSMLVIIWLKKVEQTDR